MVVCELYQNHRLFEPKMQTGLLSSFELAKEFEFPIRICDLTPNTHVGISIYDLSKPRDQSLLACTALDIFDQR